MAAYVQGADYVCLRIQFTRDGVPIAFEEDLLENSTDGSGKVSDHVWSEIGRLDAGYRFQRGDDLPWKKLREPYEFDVDRKTARATIPSLETVLQQAPLDCRFILRLSLWNPQAEDQLFSLKNLLARHDQRGFIILGENVEHVALARKSLDNCRVDRIGLFVDGNPAAAKADVDLFYYRGTPPSEPRGDYIVESEDCTGNPAAWGLSCSSLLDAFVGGQSRVYFEDDFEGEQLKNDYWYAGISSGFEQHARYLFDAANQRRLVADLRENFDTRLFVKDGINIDIREGFQYASAGVISRLPLRGDFAAEVDWTFSNPQRATQMAVGLRNSDIFSTHRAPFDKFGEVAKTPESEWVDMWEVEHQVFDTHGGPPFVMIEHEEKDGNRLCSNRVHSGFFRWYNNFYFPNVGDGSVNEGRFRLQRRNSFFTAYFKDKHNPAWVGISSAQNESMNPSVYLTLGAKHYPKREAPGLLPANRVTYRSLKIFKIEIA